MNRESLEVAVWAVDMPKIESECDYNSYVQLRLTEALELGISAIQQAYPQCSSPGCTVRVFRANKNPVILWKLREGGSPDIPARSF